MMSDAMRRALQDAEDPNAGLDDLIASAGESPAPKVIDVPVPAEQFQAAGAPRSVQTGEAAHAPTQLSRLSAALLSLEQEKPTETELKAARDADAAQTQRAYFETAARQLVGGITLTKPAETLTPFQGNAEAGLQKRSMDYESKRNALLALEGRETDAAAQRTEQGRHNAASEEIERTKAASTKDVREGELKARQDALALKEKELADRAARGAAGAKAKADADAKKAANAEALSSMPFEDGAFKPPPGVVIPEEELKPVRAKVSLAAKTSDALNAYKKALQSALAHPTDPIVRGRVHSAASGAATLLNSYREGGTMQDNEFRRAMSALGDINSPQYYLDLIDRWKNGKEDPAITLGALDETQQTFRRGLEASLAPYHMKFERGSNPSGTPPIPAKQGRPIVQGPKGERGYLNPDGSVEPIK